VYLDASRQVLGVQTRDVVDIHESGDQLLPIDNPGDKGGLMDERRRMRAPSRDTEP
jgi:hypothetical protein